MKSIFWALAWFYSLMSLYYSWVAKFYSSSAFEWYFSKFIAWGYRLACVLFKLLTLTPCSKTLISSFLEEVIASCSGFARKDPTLEDILGCLPISFENLGLFKFGSMYS